MTNKRKTKKLLCPSNKHCEGDLVLRRINHTLTIKGNAFIIPDIEVWECNSCGERFYTYKSSKKIDLHKKLSETSSLKNEHQRPN